MTIGDQGCTHCTGVGSRVATPWHPWSFWGAFCFWPVYFHISYL